MNYLKALRQVHELLSPANYLEIGCRHGTSLALSRCPSIGVDPAFELRRKPKDGVRLYEMTSDAFFEIHDPRTIFGAPVDFAFIDGMHLSEFALRDFMNIENSSHRDGLIAIDDVLPDRMEYASRERNTKIWTGDIYRTVAILKEYRPDLDIRVYSIEMKGFCLVEGLDPGNTIIRDNLNHIESRIAAGDWIAPSREALGAMIRPLPTEQLEQDLQHLVRQRTGNGRDG